MIARGGISVRIFVASVSFVFALLTLVGHAAADPVRRYSFTVHPYAELNLCNEDEFIAIAGEGWIVEKDTLREGSEHYVRQVLQRSTVFNLASGDL